MKNVVIPTPFNRRVVKLYWKKVRPFIVWFLPLFLYSTASEAQSSLYTLTFKNHPFGSALDSIEKQSGNTISFIYKNETIRGARPVTFSVNAVPLYGLLNKLFAGQPLSYEVKGSYITIVPIKTSLPNPKTNLPAMPGLDTILVSGRVFAADSKMSLIGATVKIKGTAIGVTTGPSGMFSLSTLPRYSLVISNIGYTPKEIGLSEVGSQSLMVSLDPLQTQLEAVSIVSTGYQTIARERATGSFALIKSDEISRKPTTNFLERIDGMASGVSFNNQAIGTIGGPDPQSKNLGLNIRGQSTINSSRNPLIVVDFFAYDGELSNINPNTIESITVLKDAAAASIWGARSANGVIVVTTKKGRRNEKMSVEVNTNITLKNKPDLFKDRNYLSTQDYIDVETLLFNKGFFNSDLNNVTAMTPVSPLVDILSRRKAGLITETEASQQIERLQGNNVRQDFYDYVYQKAFNQQYAIALRGGGQKVSYALAFGHDNNRDNVIRNGFVRTTVNSQSTYYPLKNLEVSAALNYSSSSTLLNNTENLYGSDFSINTKYRNLYPYAKLKDEVGRNLNIIKGYKPSYIQQTADMGFLDWNYNPLDEIKNADFKTAVRDMVLRIGAKYKIRPFLNMEVHYQNQVQNSDSRNLHKLQSYYTRNLINQFAQYDDATGSINYILPLGSIVGTESYQMRAQNLRGQINYDQSFAGHNITAIAGTEIRQLETEGFARSLYGYDDQFGTANNTLDYISAFPLNPSGSAMIPAPESGINGTTYRYLSYYANAAYSYKGRYTFTISGRKDGANIFGARTNDKITPLWSTGIGWLVSEESFYKMGWLPYLRLRATYGYNGNVNNGSAYLTGGYWVAEPTGLPYISVNTAPNPQLRWEKVRNVNLGVDFATRGDLISGSIEFYEKQGLDLLQKTPLSPQTGFPSFMSNRASTQTKGIDLTLQTSNLHGALKWNTILLASFITDKLTHYDVAQTSTSLQTSLAAAVGKPLYSIFSYRWAGLDGATGDPRGYLNGKESKDYAGIINNFNPDSLVFNGSARPKFFGSIRNEISFKRFSLSVIIAYKLDYCFRRPSIRLNYADMLSYYGNADYAYRWQKPGDERTTEVPSLVYPANARRNTFYTYSEVLVENGSHIRLQDVRLSYDVAIKGIQVSKVLDKLQVYGYANNLGIIWRANKKGIDPDAYGSGMSHEVASPFSFSFGINATF
ncbi:SusC/RagA family TonB-linked outer membrane protein [Chitinophaga sp. RCC_12]|uniref:SusC/RagA family TonB-linked outer membrane protein n=1 Tax=Chitinophaga sp. RCC_12 TaxID=3239226 RepID=UPI003524E39E